MAFAEGFGCDLALCSVPVPPEPEPAAVCATLCYLGVAFAQRPVAVQRAADPAVPLPFRIAGDDGGPARTVHYAGTCPVHAATTLLCVPAVAAPSAASASAPHKCRKHAHDHPGSRSSLDSDSDNTDAPAVWDVVGVFQTPDIAAAAAAAAAAPTALVAVASSPAAVLPLLLDAFPEMPAAARAHFCAVLSIANATAAASAVPGEQQEEEDPAEQRSAELLEFAAATWRDVTGSAEEEENAAPVPWPVFVARLCANPCHTARTDPATVGALHALFCAARTPGAVTPASWARFVCLFCVARPRDTRDVFAWAEAAALARQPWFCGPLGAARAAAALARSGRACSEFLVRYSDALWRHGVFVLSRSRPAHDPVHTRVARHCPGDTWLLALTPGGTVRCVPLAAAPHVYAATGDRARPADLFYYAVPYAEDVDAQAQQHTRTAWPTLSALVADLHDHYRAAHHPQPLVPSHGITLYND